MGDLNPNVLDWFLNFIFEHFNRNVSTLTDSENILLFKEGSNTSSYLPLLQSLGLCEEGSNHHSTDTKQPKMQNWDFWYFLFFNGIMLPH